MSCSAARKWVVPVLLLFCLGIVLSGVGAFAPVHEWYHMKAARDVGIGVLSHTHTSVTVERGNVGVILSGYWNELALWGVLALALGRWGSLFAGYYLATFVSAQGSHDFLVGFPRRLMELGYSHTDSLEVLAGNTDRWQLVGAVGIVLMLSRYAWLFRRLYEEKKAAPV